MQACLRDSWGLEGGGRAGTGPNNSLLSLLLTLAPRWREKKRQGRGGEENETEDEEEPKDEEEMKKREQNRGRTMRKQRMRTTWRRRGRGRRRGRRGSKKNPSGIKTAPRNEVSTEGKSRRRKWDTRTKRRGGWKGEQ